MLSGAAEASLARPANEKNRSSTSSYDPECYICPGNRRASGARNPEYEHVFVFDNDYPSLVDENGPSPESAHPLLLSEPERGRCRVVSFSPRHDVHLSCEAAVAAVRHQAASTRALRDVSVELLDTARSAMDETTYRRALHVIRENGRTLEMAQALRRGDIESLDGLMADSHKSLCELYEVSSPDLDRVVGYARSHPGCRGARMTGAGFGGCAVALVDKEQKSSFAAELRASTAELYTCQVVSGAEILESEIRRTSSTE